MATYHIVFEGKLTGEIGLADVKKNIGTLFKMNPAQVESLFGGKPVAIKRDVDETTAKKYAAAFKKSGALCNIVAAGAPAASNEPAKSKPAATPASSSSNIPAMDPSKDRTGRSAGKGMVNIPVPQDLGDMSMGNAGEPIPTLDLNTPVEIPDISSLSLGGDENHLQSPSNPEEPDVDISGLSMEKE